VDSQGPEARGGFIQSRAYSAIVVAFADVRPFNDTDTPKPPAGPDDDCDGDPNQ